MIQQQLAANLLAIHLHGSALDGGLKPLSDIDRLVVIAAEGQDHVTLHRLKRALRDVPAPLGQHAAQRELQFNEWLTLRSPSSGNDVMTSPDKVHGPASYFPSIEKTYGKPVKHWLQLLDLVQDKKHMEQVAFLKDQHKLGHGHANALVAYHRAQNGT